MQKKLMLGHKVRRLRRTSGLTQLQMAEQFLHRQRVDDLVDDQPHGTLRAVRAQIDDRLAEPDIGHARHRDQQLTGEIARIALRCRAPAQGPFSRSSGHVREIDLPATCRKAIGRAPPRRTALRG